MNSSSARVIGALFLTFIGAQPVPAQQKPFASRLENFDRRAQARVVAPRRADQNARRLDHVHALLPGATVDFDETTQTPRFVRAREGFLSGPRGLGGSITAAAGAGLDRADPHYAIKAFLNEHRSLFGHGAEVLGADRIKREFITPHNGMRTTVWHQALDGIPVFAGVLVAHVARDGSLVSLGSHFQSDPPAAVRRATGRQGRAGLIAAPPLSAKEALIRAARNIGEEVPETSVRTRGSPVGESQRQRFAASGVRGEGITQFTWLPVDADRLRLCWEVFLTGRTQGELFRVLIDAETGEVWLRHSLTAYLSEASYRVYTSDSPSPFSPGHPDRSTHQPALVDRSFVTWSALDTNASPNGWINDGDNETRGNNVDAHTDADNDDEPDLPRPQGAPARVFDFPLDLTTPPEQSSAAAVVQLFYWCNWMHDRLYELGFTEEAGNFQVDNFGRGGLGEDPVQADAQDGSGVNNANMSTPPDGLSPRMQMYVFTGTEPDRDGDFDAEVILHEYTHGLSNRRVGGGVGLSELQSTGMGEGWSDFYGLALLSEAGDDLEGNYAAGGYLTFQLDGLMENYYFGIRRYPYSTDLSRNPLTFKDIDPQQAIAHDGIPVSPRYLPFSPFFASEVHSQGEVWCVTLWEARANLIRKHGFPQGNQLLLQLVTDGMNLSPANPNFLEARDAILLADRVNNGGANQAELWAAFVKRGMGVSANSPPSSTTRDVREAFDPPDDLVMAPQTDLASMGDAGGPFNPSMETYFLTNTGSATVVWTAHRSAGWISVNPASGTLLPGGPAVSVRVTLDSSAASLPGGIHAAVVSISNASTRVVQPRRVTLRIREIDYFTETFDTVGSELAFTSLTFTPDGSPSFYSVCREPVTRFFTDPSGGIRTNLSVFQTAQLTLTSNVSLYGYSTNVIHAGSSGFLAFDPEDTFSFDSTVLHFAYPRVSVLFALLDPSDGGGVSWKQLEDRVAVTYLDVPEFLSGSSNSFQAELFFDGRIRLTYLDLASSNAVVGLSRGGGEPLDFFESDFASFPRCGRALTLVLPPGLDENAGSLPAIGRVRLPASVTTNVTVTLTSSDPTELQVPPTLVILAGETEVSIDLELLADGELDGTQIVQVRAAASGFGPAAARVRIFDNEVAMLNVLLPAVTREGTLSITGLVTMSSTSAHGIAVSLESSDTNELKVPPLVIVPSGLTSVVFQASVNNDLRLDGTQTVSVTARIEHWGLGVGMVSIFDDEPTNLVVRLPRRLREGAGLLLNAGRVRLGGVVSTNLVVTLSSSDHSELTLPKTVIVPGGNSEASFEVVVVDDSEVDSTQAVTVGARAPGLAAGAAVVHILDDEAPWPAAYPQPAHQASNVTVITSLAWSGGEYNELIVNGDFEAGDFTGWTRRESFLGDFQINTTTNDPPSPDGPLPPFEGEFSALAEQFGSGIHQIYQDVALPTGSPRVTLNWADRVRNFAERFSPSQQYRVEIRNTNDLLLALAHGTGPGDPLLGDWVTRQFDLTRYAGETVRIAFMVNPGNALLGVHIDSVSVAMSSPRLETFGIYLGTDTNLGPAQFLGSTTNRTWPLPPLSPGTTYYWQIVARTLGETAGPIWRFSTRGVHHFEWAPIPSPQIVDQPFRVTLIALDEFNTVVSNFNGSVALSSVPEIFPVKRFEEGFEDGNFDGWNVDSGSYIRAVTEETSEVGERSLTLIGGSEKHGDGVTHPLPNLQPDEVRFRVRAGRTDAAGGYVVMGSRANVTNRAVFFYMQADGGMGLYEEQSFGHFVPFAANRWYDVTLVFAWTNRTVDFYVDRVLVEAGVPFLDTNVTQLNYITLYNYDFTQSWWDAIEMSSEGVATHIAISLAESEGFNQGVWKGNVAVLEPAIGIRLHAESTDGQRGISAPLDVLGSNDLAVRIEDDPDPVRDYSPVVYTVSALNSGPSAASGVWLTNFLPAGATFASFSVSQGECVIAGETIVCDLATIPAGGRVVLTVQVQPTRLGILTNRAVAMQESPEMLRSNNTAVALTTVVAPVLNIAETQSISEGNAGVRYLSFPVSLSSSSALPVSVSFSTSNRTAVASGDYGTANGLLFFAPGVTQQEVFIRVNGDSFVEASETFVIYLNRPVNATLGHREAIGVIVDDDQTTAASLPFVEDWESGRLRPFWSVTGSGAFRAIVSNENGPHGGSFHLQMDNSLENGTEARNEVTLLVDLEGWTNVVLRFWAADFFGFVDGPPPIPFIGSADFDGVAVSSDGVHWYEAESFLSLDFASTELVVELDQLLETYGLGYSPRFRIRYNLVATYSAPFDGIVIDDISLDGRRTSIVPGNAEILSEDCAPANGVIDPGEWVTLNLELTNSSDRVVRNLTATLLADGGIGQPSIAQEYGLLANGGPSVARPFTFRAEGDCGGSIRATLQLREGEIDLGRAMFTLPIGAGSTNRHEFLRTNTVVIAISGIAIPYPSSLIVTGVTGSVRKVTATFHGLSHALPDAVNVLLVGPQGQACTLLSDAGGNNAATNLTLTFDSTGTNRVSDDGPLASGVYSPIDYGSGDFYPSPAPGGPYGTTLEVFNGINPNGAWRLYVDSDGVGVVGRIAGGWSLNIETVTGECCGAGPSADLSLRLLDFPDPVVAEGNIVYSLQVTNLGPAPATGVVVTDLLPAAARFLTVTSSLGSCTNDNGTIRCQLGTLPANVSALITLTLQGLEPGPLTNSASVSAKEMDLNRTSNFATAITTVNAPAISAGPVTVMEGTGEHRVAIFNVTLGSRFTQTALVHFLTSDGTAHAGHDYLPTNGVLEFPPGVQNQRVAITILGDSLDESNESFTLNLFNPVHAIVGSATVGATIVDDDTPPALSVGGTTVAEGNSGLQSAQLSVGLSAPSGNRVELHYATIPGTARAPSDFVTTNGRVVLLPGQTNGIIEVFVVGDLLNELNEAFALSLTAPLNATLLDGQAAVAILNDDLQAAIAIFGTDLLAESCLPTNGVLDPDETVSISLILRNDSTGGARTTNLTATLLEMGGISAPSAPQNYGALPAGARLERTFSFIVGAACSETVQAVWSLQDGLESLGMVTNSFQVGSPSLAGAENFDAVAPPNLPAGWTALLTGTGLPWRTTTAGRQTAPYAVFAATPASATVNDLTSPAYEILTREAQLSFQHNFSTESNYDGGLLEISMNAGPFIEIQSAGGRFIIGGYNGTINFGTRAWTGSSGMFVPVMVELPGDAAEKSVRFRWHLTTDSSVGAGGWYVDTITLDDGYSCCAPPALRIDSISLDRSSVILRWNSIPGRRYRIQHARAIDSPLWADLPGEIIADGPIATRMDSVGPEEQRFYRVILE